MDWTVDCGLKTEASGHVYLVLAFITWETSKFIHCVVTRACRRIVI